MRAVQRDAGSGARREDDMNVLLGSPVPEVVTDSFHPHCASLTARVHTSFLLLHGERV